MFQTGSNKWTTHTTWPPKGVTKRTLYFHPNGKLAFVPPATAGHDEYVSDPANPVPYRPRPVTPTYPGREWREWMTEDQRFAQARPDVLTYVSDPLTEDMTVAGSMVAKLFAATSGTDSDWIVRLIDVYPEDYPDEPELGGFQQLLIGEPVRARFRKSLEKPEPVVAHQVEPYPIDLHWGTTVSARHRVMVQVSSTWFR